MVSEALVESIIIVFVKEFMSYLSVIRDMSSCLIFTFG
jgi:hypothetical protein